MSGGYRGGFILEGFRVKIPSNKDTMTVTVTNGIAIDRGGRLITLEEGEYFLNNSPDGKDIDLLDSAEKNYLMLEFTLAGSDSTERAFWDPTYPNPAILDSDGDSVPQPRGKEFSQYVETRKAHDWTILVSSSGFEDTADPNKLRIPLAVIPVNTAGPAINLTNSVEIWHPSTSVIEKPLSRLPIAPWTISDIPYIQCADTRLFPSSGAISVYRKDLTPRWFSVAGVNTQVIEYTGNDRENNRLYLAGSTQVRSGNDVDGFPYEEPEITDIVQQETYLGVVPSWYLREANEFDCRPMFFSVTEVMGSKAETPDQWPLNADGERRTDSRQFKYWSGLALIQHPTPNVPTETYPSISYGQTVTVTYPSQRLETRIKQNQDFFRVLASLVQEAKYGYAEVEKGSWVEAEVTSAILESLGLTSTGGEYLIDNTKNFTQQYVGSSVLVVSGPNQGERLAIERVYGNSVLHFSTTAPNPFGLGDQYELELNFPTTYGGYVEQYKLGSLREVYNARVDQFTDTYAKDLNRRLTNNKVATITVGDGISTFGDYVGDAGLRAAFFQAFAQKRGAVIYVRAGSYDLGVNYQCPIGSNTTIVGDGPGVTNISLNNSAVGPTCFMIRDYENHYTTPATQPSVASNITFKNLSLLGSNGPVLVNSPIEHQTSPGVTGGAMGTGAWRTTWGVNNSPTYIDNLTIDNVHISGGIIGPWTTDADCSYAVYLVSDETWNLTSGNSEITFKNCKFYNSEGGALLLKTCKGVKITDCTFDSTGADKMLEGVTFSSRCTDVVAGIPFHGFVNTDGNIQVSGCTFTGAMYDESVVLNPTTYPADNKRGWINFTPSYLGINTSISDCQFQGYLMGNNVIVGGVGATYARAYEGDPQIGTCIVKCGGNDLLVTGCNFGNYNVGVISQVGITTINNCRFFQVTKTTIVDQQISATATNNSWKYVQFSGASGTVTDWNYWSTMYLAALGSVGEYRAIDFGLKTEIKSCTFSGQQTGTLLPSISNNRGCIVVHSVLPFLTSNDQSSPTDRPRYTLSIDSCNFNDIEAVFSADYLKPIASLLGYLSYNWDLISISNCVISGVTTAVEDNETWLWHTAADSVDYYSTRTAQITNFVYNNNTHYKCVYYGSSTNQRGFVAIGAEKISIKGNIFDGLSPTAIASAAQDLNPVCSFAVGAGGLTFDGNEFLNCFPGANQTQITMLQASIMSVTVDSTTANTEFAESSGPLLDISNNKFTPTEKGKFGASVGAGRVSNGVLVDAYYPDVTPLSVGPDYTNGILHTTIGEHFWPKLIFNNNDLYLNNGNFGLLSKQHTGYDSIGNDFDGFFANLWAWYAAEIKNNKVILNVEDDSVNFQYENEVSAPLTFLNPIVVRPTADLNNGVTSVPLPGPMGGETLAIPFLGSSFLAIPQKFYACIDLRSMARLTRLATGLDSMTSWPTTTISNNNLEIKAQNTLHTANSVTHEYMGLRISKFPVSPVKITDNGFGQAPLVLSWVFLNPYFSLHRPITPPEYIGYTYQIEGNNFIGGLDGPIVYIDSAIGFGTELTYNTSSGPLISYSSANIYFNNNVVSNHRDVMISNNWPFRGYVKFASPYFESYIQNGTPLSATNLLTYDGGFGMGAQCYTPWHWEVCNNKLKNSYFIITNIQTSGTFGGRDFWYNQNPNSDGIIGPDDAGDIRAGFSYFSDNYFESPYHSIGQGPGGQVQDPGGANQNSFFGFNFTPIVPPGGTGSWPVATTNLSQDDLCNEDGNSTPFALGDRMRGIVAGTHTSKWQQPSTLPLRNIYSQPAVADKNTLVEGDP